MIKICAECGTEFEAAVHNQTLCSDVCTKAARARRERNRRARIAQQREPRISHCEICGGEMIDARPTKKHCSPACKREAARLHVEKKRHAKRSLIRKNCVVCGTEFGMEAGYLSRITCSEKCRQIQQRDTQYRWRRENSDRWRDICKASYHRNVEARNRAAAIRRQRYMTIELLESMT